jgi:hypothetical protein
MASPSPSAGAICPGGGPSIATARQKLTGLVGGMIMATDRIRAGFASKTIYALAAVIVLVFVAMLVLTVLHP